MPLKKKKVNFFSSRRSWFQKFCYPFQSPLLGCSDSPVFRVHGEVGVLSGKPYLCVHFIPESRCPDLYASPSSAHTSTSEVAWSSSYPSPILGGTVGRRAAGLLQRAAVGFHCFVTEISWEDSLFISLDPESPDLRQGGPTQAEGFWEGQFSFVVKFELILYAYGSMLLSSNPLFISKNKTADWGCGRWHFISQKSLIRQSRETERGK